MIIFVCFFCIFPFFYPCFSLNLYLNGKMHIYRNLTQVDFFCCKKQHLTHFVFNLFYNQKRGILNNIITHYLSNLFFLRWNVETQNEDFPIFIWSDLKFIDWKLINFTFNEKGQKCIKLLLYLKCLWIIKGL